MRLRPLRTLLSIRCGRFGFADSLIIGMTAVFSVGQIAKADAHVVVNGTGYGNGDADAQDGVRQCGHVDVAIVQEDEAGCASPDER